MEKLVITNGKLLTPQGIIDPGTLMIENGIISEVLKRKPDAEAGRTMGVEGNYVLPGFVNLHSDCIETEVTMQRRLLFPISAALVNLDQKLASWGISSEFHAINFSDAAEKGRSVALSEQLVEEVVRFRELGKPLVRHFVHVRCDPSSDPGTDLACKLVQEGKVEYASLQEHTPGVGAYKDLEFVRARYSERYSVEETKLQRLLQQGQERRKFVNANEGRFARVTTSYGVPLASHDDDTEEKVEYMSKLGVTLSEFPVSLAVARRARALGMKICMGAPNAFRGISSFKQQNHLSAREALQVGLVDILCSDYYPPALVYAAFTLAQEGILGLIPSLNLISLNPAKFIGKGDVVGSLEKGKEADIVIVKLHHGIPIVICTIVKGKIVYKTKF